MKGKTGYQLIQPSLPPSNNYVVYGYYHLFWVAVGYYLWKKMLSITGYRFHPTDFELLRFYLHNKNLGRDSLVQAIPQVDDICGLEPWELPGHSNIHSGDGVWYFFSRPNYKYRNSTRIKRTTGQGYWKPTGNPRKVMAAGDHHHHPTEIGKKRTLVYYKGRFGDKDKNKTKTGWVMHEYELTSTLPAPVPATFVLCKLKKKYGKGEVSCIEEGHQSTDHCLPPNIGNYIAGNAIPAEATTCLKEQSEMEVFNVPDEGVEPELELEYQSTELPWSSYLAGECHDDVPKNEITDDLPFNAGSHFAENNAIPSDLNSEVQIKGDVGQNDQSGTNEQDSMFGNLAALPAHDGRSNQHNLVLDNHDGYSNPTAGESVQMDMSNLAARESPDEIFAGLEALSEVQGNMFSEWISDICGELEIPYASVNQSNSTNEEHSPTATNGGCSSLTTVSKMDSCCLINLSRKRSRIHYQGFDCDV